jgi:MFS family permease
MAAQSNSELSGRVAFTYPSFTVYQLARFFIVLATEMQSVAVGWQVYAITRRPLDLGLVGLAQFLPGIFMFLISGHAADRYDRRKVLMAAYVGYGTCSSLLLFMTLRGVHSIYPIYAVMSLVGVARSFNAPSSRAILPQLVPEEHFQSAYAWGATIFQGAVVIGPALGGLVYTIARGAAPVYVCSLCAAVGAAISMMRIELRFASRQREPVSVQTVLAGLRYVWHKKVVLGSITLDLFAVLLGGATFLLPAFVRDVLRVGPWGLGLLRCAPAIGAASTALLLAHRPVGRRAGAKMLWCVGGFGAATILFGLSRSIVVAMIALILVGASDMVSVVVRGIVVQLATPDEMRGRVNAVDMVFIGASNELGGFESGLTAQWLGTVPAIILGGAGAILVTILCAWLFPEVRNADQLVETEREREAAAV